MFIYIIEAVAAWKFSSNSSQQYIVATGTTEYNWHCFQFKTFQSLHYIHTLLDRSLNRAFQGSLTTTPGTICPTLCDKCVGSFTSHRIVWTVKGCETGPTVYSPYPRRLESLTICECNSKGNTFSSRMAARCSTDWATGAQLRRHFCDTNPASRTFCYGKA